MKYLPKTLIRLDDGAKFILNEPDNLYYLRLTDDDLGMFGYTYERLMDDYRSKGNFKVADGTEDTEQMMKNWMDRTRSTNTSGCGDDDGC